MDTQKIKEYLYGNLASTFWSLFLLIGGGIFILYYAHIGYMPDFDFKSSITLLSAASVTAMVIVLLFLTILIFPGACWANWANTTQLKRYWEDDEGNKKLLKTTLYFGAPIIFCYGLFFIWYQYGVFTMLLYTVTGTAFCYILLSKTGLHKKELWKEFGEIVFTSLICSILTLFPIYIVSSLTASTSINSKGDPIFIGLVVALFIAFANIMAIAKPPKINGFLWYLGLGLMTFIVLVSSFEITYRIPERVMEIYKFGSIHTKSIVFKSDGCETLKILGVAVSGENNKQCSLSGVKILSRLGKEMYLEKDSLKFTISSTEIISWSVDETSDNKIQPTAKSSS